MSPAVAGGAAAGGGAAPGGTGGVLALVRAAFAAMARFRGLTPPVPWYATGELSSDFPADGPPRLLAELYERGLSRDGRKASGTFFTPEYLVDWLVQATLGPLLDAGVDWSDLTVVDPAVGGGDFLAGALRYLTARTEAPPAAVARCLYGLDLDPAAVAVAQMRLWLEAGGTALPHLRTGNALHGWDWRAAFPQVFARGGFVAVLGNPPWGAQLPAPERAALRRAYPDILRGEINSYTPFVARALNLVRPGGLVGYVVPEGWLVNKGEEAFRRWLLDQADLHRLAVLRKGVFPGAPDVIPVLLVAARGGPPSPGAPSATSPGTQVHLFGFNQPRRRLPELVWEETKTLLPQQWRDNPFAIFTVNQRAGLLERYRVLRETCTPLSDATGRRPRLVHVSDGVYKTRLRALLGPGGPPALLAAAELQRYTLQPAGATLAADAWVQLTPGERAKFSAPKLLLHALKKPGVRYRVAAAYDPGGLVASNNFLVLTPAPECPCDLHFLLALLNSRFVNRWYSDHFIQVNIEAYTLGAIPIPPVDRPTHDALAELARRRAPDAEVDALVYRLYGLTPAEVAVVEATF